MLSRGIVYLLRKPVSVVYTQTIPIIICHTPLGISWLVIIRFYRVAHSVHAKIIFCGYFLVLLPHIATEIITFWTNPCVFPSLGGILITIIAHCSVILHRALQGSVVRGDFTGGIMSPIAYKPCKYSVFSPRTYICCWFQFTVELSARGFSTAVSECTNVKGDMKFRVNGELLLLVLLRLI